MKIENFRSKNIYYDQLLDWKKSRYSPDELKESFEPIESKWGADKVLASDIFKVPTKELSTEFNKEWINDIEKDQEEDEYTYKLNLLKCNGFNLDEARLIIRTARANALRAAAWSKANISLGKSSTIFSLLSLFFDIAKEGLALGTTGHEDNETTGHEDNWTAGLLGQLYHGDAEPYSLLSSIASFFHSIFRSQRNHFQYKIYSLPDDDAAMNVYQADVYGNKIAGSLAKASTYMETKINPLLIPVTELLPKNIGESIKKIISLPTSLWWRARLPAYINQEFFTDFLNYLLNKPLSIFGNQDSKKKILEITKRENLKWDYIKRRHIAAVETLHETSPIMHHIKSLFNKDPTISAASGKRLGEFIAPALGIYGFFASALGNTTSALFKLFKVENIYSKISNLIQYSSIYSQQLVYFPKIIIPFLAETRQIEKIVNEFSGNNERKDEETCEETCDRKSLEELKLLAKERKITSYAGVLSFIVHSISMASRLIGIAGDRFRYVPKYISRITEELSSGLINFFFSSRRYLMGEQFRIENPEFYA